LLRSTWHHSLQQRHLRWASDPYRGFAASSTSIPLKFNASEWLSSQKRHSKHDLT
jgi:hypothetical protein